MKIFVRDDNDRKISHWHIDHWEAQGHEVIQNMYPDWDQVAWSDVAIFFWCDQYAQQFAEKGPEFKCKKIIQCVDIDGWAGHWGTVKWQNIDRLVFMSEHIRDMVMGHLLPQYEENFPTPLIHLPLGIDVTQWKYKNRTEHHGYNVGFIADEIWSAKNPAMNIQFMAKLLKEAPQHPWHFYWSGKFGPEKWLRYYLEHMIKAAGLTEYVTVNWNREDSIVDFYDKIDYFVTFSQKDSYSLIVGEAMASGVKTLIHNFYGAEGIWDKKYIWTTLDELVEKILGEYDSSEYYQYIQEHHNMDEILKRWDMLL